MSEADVSLIRDEDVLRRMWQQTEDFSRKKEIRAHMYKLREERLRDLYSPEPLGKGGDHMASFADQSFQRIKGKEVRDAASPTKDFADRHQDLNELSHAGWNVLSENKTTDDGHTRIEALQADIQGHYDVEGGKGHFAAIDQQTSAQTEYKDDHKHVKKQENVAKSRTQEQVYSTSGDGTQCQMSSTTSSRSSQHHQVSSVNETIPLETADQRSESRTTDRREYSRQNNKQTRQTNYEQGELISRKVDYPDDNTKVVVETRCLPDGTKVISTKKEFRGQDISHSERQSQSKSESKSFSSQQHSNIETSSKVKEQNYENRRDIVDSQRAVDDYDFNKNYERIDRRRTDDSHDYDVKNEKFSTTLSHNNLKNVSSKISNQTSQNYESTVESNNIRDNNDVSINRRVIEHKQSENIDERDRRDSVTSQQSKTTQYTVNESVIQDVKHNEINKERIEKTTSDQYQTTYQDHYTQKKISNDWSPSHQAWASTLRADTPSTTRPSTRASSPGSRTFQSSTSSLRSSVSPDKIYRQPGSRGSSPTKADRYSPSRSDKYSSTNYTQSVSESRMSESNTQKYVSPERKRPSGKVQTSPDSHRHRPSVSPEKRPDIHYPRSSASPEKRLDTHHPRSSASPDKRPDTHHSRSSASPEKRPNAYNPRSSLSPEKRLDTNYQRPSVSPEKVPHDKNNTENEVRGTSPVRKAFRPFDNPTSPASPEKLPKSTEKPVSGIKTTSEKASDIMTSRIKENKSKFTDKNTSHTVVDDSRFATFTRSSKSPSPTRKSPVKESSPLARPETPTKPTLRQGSRSPSPPKGPVTFTTDTYDIKKTHTKVSTYDSSDNITREKQTSQTSSKTKHYDNSSREHSPSKHDKTYEERNVNNIIKTDNTKYENRDSVQKENQIPIRAQSPKDTYPRDSLSPAKDTKYKFTTDFIATERETEQLHKKTNHKERPRQLVTPSSSPTRKPKVEHEPSTGQSSPTSSVSGFEYYSGHVPVTDLDEQNSYYESSLSGHKNTITTSSEYKDSDSVKQRSPSPSKIPCRSPSLEKNSSPIKETLPRKSSLKKPSVDLTSSGKTPSESLVSPTKEDLQNNKPEKGTVKVKPPFERRETYEERCRKILGMIDDKTTLESTSTLTSTNVSAPSESDYSTPTLRGESPNNYSKATITTNTTTDVTDFISNEKDDTLETTQINKSKEKLSKLKNPSRESSPTKLKNIITDKVTNLQDTGRQYNEKSQYSVDITKLKDNTPRKSPSPQRTINRSVSPKKDQAPKVKSTSRESSPTKLKDITTETSTELSSQSTDILYSRRQSANKQSQPLVNTTGPRDSIPRKSPSPQRTINRSVSPKKEQSYKVKSPSRESSPTKLMDIITEKTTRVSSQNTNISSSVRQNNEKLSQSTINTTASRDSSPRKSSSPQRTIKTSDSPKKQQSIISDSSITRDNKIEELHKIKTNEKTDTHIDYSSHPTVSPTRRSEKERINITKSGTPVKQTHDARSRTPSPTKNINEKSGTKTTNGPTKNIISETVSNKVNSVRKSEDTLVSSSENKIVDTIDFIITEREREVLEKVQKSLRKLSPQRTDRRSPSQEKSFTNKTTISLQDLDEFEVSTSNVQTNNINESTEIKIQQTRKIEEEKKQDKKDSTKPNSRNVSPVKKISPVSPPKSDKKVEPSTKLRSISPKKAMSSSLDRPHSPQILKTSGTKPQEPSPKTISKPATRNSSPTKLDKTSFDKKSPVTKQNSSSNVTKSTTIKSTITSNKIDLNSKRSVSNIPNKNINKENVSPKRESDRINRTTSDISMRLKKPSPQRVKSKPEIQVNDSPKSPPIANKQQTIKESPSKLAPKPKSATALNTSIDDDDDIIIDVELAKSSRENSPDRICPTPVGFMEDVGTPRLPDEVNEPDDEFKKRTHHVIHETESIVDDIVEISEEEELFVKQSEKVSDSDECLLSVTDKVSKFTDKISAIGKPKDTTIAFKDTERRQHSDYVDENLKSDECLMSVSQKVNKFAKGQVDTKENNSSSRKIDDEYDFNTVYQDDYTKLSVNDKAHLFIETAENSKTTKTKPVQKVQRPDFTNVDESLKSDDCLLSVSDKVNKFVKTAEQFLTETRLDEEKERKIREQHDFIMRQIVNDVEDVRAKETFQKTDTTIIDEAEVISAVRDHNDRLKDSTSLQTKPKDYSKSNLKTSDKSTPVKITTLRSSESVKKAKALFENIASTTQKSKDTKATRLTDIGIIRKSTSSDSANSKETTDDQITITKTKCEVDGGKPADLPAYTTSEKKLNSPSTRLAAPLSDNLRQKSPVRQTLDTPRSERRSVSPRPPIQSNKDKENVPSYQRATMTSQLKEEVKVTEDYEVSTRRGSGKFGVELRRSSADKSILERGPSSERPSGERRRSSDRHQPCIEDIYDVALLEQMLEKVVGYEQRRRIRAQIRVAKKKVDEHEETQTKSTKTIISSKTVNVERQRTKSPDHQPSAYSQRVPSTELHVPKIAAHKTISPDRAQLKDQNRFVNGHATQMNGKVPRTPSPDKITKTKSRSPMRQPSPDKKARPLSPTKATSSSKPKSNRFSEYAAAYMKKVGLNDKEAIKTDVNSIKSSKGLTKTAESQNIETVHVKEHKAIETKVSSSSITRSVTERKSSYDTVEVKQMNGKRSPSPEKRKSPERRATSPLKTKQRSPSPVKSPKPDTTTRKETTIKTIFDIEKKIQPKPVQEEKPSWVTNRNLKKITTDTRTFSSKKIEPERPKQRAPSPSKVITKPTDVITSSYGPGPLDADGKPLFGIKALRNGASNYQVKGTVIRQEFHSHNGSAPEGSISVTAYSSQPEPLEQLLQQQGQVQSPRFLQGLAAITTTKKFGGSTGTSISEAYTKEERAAIDKFTHSDLRHTDTVLTSSHSHADNSDTSSKISITDITDDTSNSKQTSTKRSSVERTSLDSGSTRSQQKRGETVKREERMTRGDEKKTVRQSSVKSLTEKYIKSTNESTKSDRSSYPKAGLILRAGGTGRRDSPSGLPRAGSEHSLTEDSATSATTHCTTSANNATSATTTTSQKTTSVTQESKGVTSSSRRSERSFLDSSSKVTGVQDILTRMKNADIVIEDGDTSEDAEARALLNKFLGATVLMAGMQSYVTDGAGAATHQRQETVTHSSNKVSSPRIEDIDLEQCWDERLLKTLLEQCQDYEQRRRIRARLRSLMAEQEACAAAVTEALGAAGDACDEREEAEEVTSVSSSVRRDSSENTVTTTTTTTRSSKVIESMTRPAPKQVSPFAKFRQLEKQNSLNSSNGRSAPLFRLTDPALQASALTIRERLLQWCRDKTRDYENVKLENFSTSWADGLAFCALVHHFLPDAFDYSALTADQRRHNFTLAFTVADEKAGIYPLLDVEDMVAMRRPDWKCVFTYVQAIHRRFRDQR